MIDHRFSRQAFESLRSISERQLLARELGRELRDHVAMSPSRDDGLSAALARLRLIGHHLFPTPRDDGRISLAGDPAGEAPTGLEIEVREGAITEIRYR